MNNIDALIGEYNKMVSLFHNETDRGAALLGSSYLDFHLEKYLRVFLIENKIVDELFKGYAPLATFSAKINFAYALGLINESLMKDLNYIRKVRNHFAHTPDETSFNVSPVIDLCKNLSTVDYVPEQTENKARLQYLFALGKSIADINKFMLKTKRCIFMI